MSEAAPKLRFGPMLRDTWQVYKAHWYVLIPLTMFVLLPQAVTDAALGDIEVKGIEGFKDALALAAVPLFVAVNLAGEALLAGIVAALTLEWRDGRRLGSLREAARLIPFKRLIAIDLLLAIGTAAGLVLLVIPGILLFTYLLIAPALIEIEHLTIRDSVRRSYHLVKGSFWRVLGFALLIFTISDALMSLLESPIHGVEGEALFNLVIEGIAEPIVTVATVVLALALIDLAARQAEAEKAS